VKELVATFGRSLLPVLGCLTQMCDSVTLRQVRTIRTTVPARIPRRTAPQGVVMKQIV
jgi:hypothetical protein